MKRILSVALVAAAATLSSTAHAQLVPQLGIYGGITLATGGLHGTAATEANQTNGYTLGVDVGFRPPLSPLGLRIDADFSQFKQASNATTFQKTTFGDARIFQASGNLVYYILPLPTISPYLIGGGGIYNVDYSGSATSATKPGANIGGGLKFGLMGFSATVEARLHTIFGDNSVKTHYVPFTVGVAF